MSEWVKSLSRVRLFATPWTVAYQVPPSMGFSRQEYWSGLPFPSADLPNPGIEPGSPTYLNLKKKERRRERERPGWNLPRERTSRKHFLGFMLFQSIDAGLAETFSEHIELSWRKQEVPTGPLKSDREDEGWISEYRTGKLSFHVFLWIHLGLSNESFHGVQRPYAAISLGKFFSLFK